MNAIEIAQLYAKGGSIPDAEIRRLREVDLDAWTACVDPSYRASLLPKSEPTPAATPASSKVVTRAEVTRAIDVILENFHKFAKENAKLRERLATAEHRLAMVMSLISEVAPGARLQDLEARPHRDVPPIEGIASAEQILERLGTVEFRLAAVAGVVGELSPSTKIVDVMAFEKRLAAIEQKSNKQFDDALLRLVDVLQKRPSPAAMQYRGIWTKGDAYVEGDFVTDHGSLWHCCRTGTQSRPGTDDGWMLSVKRGKGR